MGPEMNAATAPWSSSAAPAGRLVALLAAAAFLLAGLTGNSFSLHVGMTTMAPAATAAADVDDKPAALAAMTSALPEVIGKASADPVTPMPISSDAQHLMHLLGACLAIVAAGMLLLVSLLGFRRAPGGGLPAVAAVTRLVTAVPRSAWRPLALSPPTSSPVIRT